MMKELAIKINEFIEQYGDCPVTIVLNEYNFYGKHQPSITNNIKVKFCEDFQRLEINIGEVEEPFFTVYGVK